jgi:hypothetical protein
LSAKGSLFLKALFLAVIIPGVSSCHVPIGFLKKLGQSQEIIDAEKTDFRFSIAGASADMVEFLVPPDNREAPYIWWKVPNNDSHIQMLRACNYYEQFGIESVNEERWWCWDKSARTLKHHTGADDFKRVVGLHPNWIWLIGNEPDIAKQDNLTPQEYAEFYGWVAKTITDQLRLEYPEAFPRMVMCQTTANPTYCETAYLFLKELVNSGYWPDWPEDLEVKDTIWAISTHKYADDCFPLEEESLSAAMYDWKKALNRFARWSNTVDGGRLADKPLWVTEFGALQAFCPEKLEMRAGVDQKGGIGCPSKASRGNGQMDDDYVFYGRNNREGIWGLQHQQIEYFVNPHNTSENNQGDWEAAWWFIAHANDGNNDGECDYTVWLFGDHTNCIKNQDSVSRGGETYRNSINCLISGENCSQFRFPASRL